MPRLPSELAEAPLGTSELNLYPHRQPSSTLIIDVEYAGADYESGSAVDRIVSPAVVNATLHFHWDGTAYYPDRSLPIAKRIQLIVRFYLD